MHSFCHDNLVIVSTFLVFTSLAFFFDTVSCFPSGAILNEDADGSSRNVLERETPNFLKRAGFVGMRGKKSHLVDGEEEEQNAIQDDDPQSWIDQELVKRARNKAGFVGMRGKKSDQVNTFDMDPSSWIDQFLSSSKRAGFVGMRGKKAGFVGMRGKKSDSESSYYDLPLWSNQLSPKTRRGSSGFVGMRGWTKSEKKRLAGRQENEKQEQKGGRKKKKLK